MDSEATNDFLAVPKKKTGGSATSTTNRSATTKDNHGGEELTFRSKKLNHKQQLTLKDGNHKTNKKNLTVEVDGQKIPEKKIRTIDKVSVKYYQPYLSNLTDNILATTNSNSNSNLNSENADKVLSNFEFKSTKPPRTYSRVRNKPLRRKLINADRDLSQSLISAARAEILYGQSAQNSESAVGYLEAENDVEKTYEVTQSEIKEHADLNTRAKLLDLRFNVQVSSDARNNGYRLSYTNNGRFLAFGGGLGGHIGVIDCLRNEPMYEIFVNETVRDVAFLNSEKLLAVAQKKYLYIYDETGAEVHRLKEHWKIFKLEYLKYHFLFVSANPYGKLVYQDVSTGEVVAQIKTKKPRVTCMRQNKYNAIIGLGHASGAVTMWSPNQNTPVVDMFCHQGPVQDVCFDNDGYNLITAGNCNRINIYDVRKTFEALHSYQAARPIQSLDISQNNLLSLAALSSVHIWKNSDNNSVDKFGSLEPYMVHNMQGNFASREITSAMFRPYEDIVAIGHKQGLKCIAVPGAGFSNFDAYEANPFETKRQFKEREVKNVLEKLQPDMITLQPFNVGRITKGAQLGAFAGRDINDEKMFRAKSGFVGLDSNKIDEEKESDDEGNDSEDDDDESNKVDEEGFVKVEKKRRKMRGKGKIGKRLKVKTKEFAAMERDKLRTKLQQA